MKWGRARAIWEAYCNTPTPAQPSENTISGPLDVYRWLEQEGHFPKLQPVVNVKSTSAKGKEKAVPVTPDLYCAVCGYMSSLHPQTTTDDGRVLPMFCTLPEWMCRTPLLDAHLLRTRNPILKVPPRSAKSKLKKCKSTSHPLKPRTRDRRGPSADTCCESRRIVTAAPVFQVVERAG